MTSVVVAARRTAVRSVRARGAAAETQDVAPADDLAAAVLAALAQEVAGLGYGVPTEVVLGSARARPGNLARRAALAAGLSVEVSAVTLDRQCGSGMDAIRIGAALTSAADTVVFAGGVESASEAGASQAPFTPPGFPDPDLAQAADDLAVQLGIDRRRQDAYTERSYRLAAQAVTDGLFQAELVPTRWASIDDRPRTISHAVLARLPAHLGRGGVTRATIAGVADGAASVALVSHERWRRHRAPALLLRGATTVGINPAEPGIGAAVAAEKLLADNGIALNEVRVIEIVEAFAAQQLACLDRLGLDPLGRDAARVSPTGGALGLGHPWGASGAIAVVRVFGQLVRQDQAPGSLGLAAVAVAGGQGVATLWERIE